jgi:hypothetical protein
MEKIEPQHMLGSELRVGDVIDVWWAPNRDCITQLRPYNGPIKELAGAQLADFAINRIGMTIEAGVLYRVHARNVNPNQFPA